MPDLTFFADPTLDRVLGVVLELAAEVYVLRDRVQTLEGLLQARGVLDPAALEQPSGAPADERARRLAARDVFINRILAPMIDNADSPAPPFEPA